MDGEGDGVAQANLVDEPKISLHATMGTISPQTMTI